MLINEESLRKIIREETLKSIKKNILNENVNKNKLVTSLESLNSAYKSNGQKINTPWKKLADDVKKSWNNLIYRSLGINNWRNKRVKKLIRSLNYGLGNNPSFDRKIENVASQIVSIINKQTEPAPEKPQEKQEKSVQQDTKLSSTRGKTKEQVQTQAQTRQEMPVQQDTSIAKEPSKETVNRILRRGEEALEDFKDKIPATKQKLTKDILDLIKYGRKNYNKMSNQEKETLLKALFSKENKISNL